MAKRYGKICVTAVGMFSKDAAWFIPHGTTTVLITVGGISEKTIEIDGGLVSREHLYLTASYDPATGIEKKVLFYAFAVGPPKFIGMTGPCGPSAFLISP